MRHGPSAFLIFARTRSRKVFPFLAAPFGPFHFTWCPSKFYFTVGRLPVLHTIPGFPPSLLKAQEASTLHTDYHAFFLYFDPPYAPPIFPVRYSPIEPETPSSTRARPVFSDVAVVQYLCVDKALDTFEDPDQWSSFSPSAAFPPDTSCSPLPCPCPPLL